eukprot:5810347-Amphidinium_carterae.1
MQNFESQKPQRKVPALLGLASGSEHAWTQPYMEARRSSIHQTPPGSGATGFLSCLGCSQRQKFFRNQPTRSLHPKPREQKRALSDSDHSFSDSSDTVDVGKMLEGELVKFVGKPVEQTPGGKSVGTTSTANTTSDSPKLQTCRRGRAPFASALESISLSVYEEMRAIVFCFAELLMSVFPSCVPLVLEFGAARSGVENADAQSELQFSFCL